MFGNKHTYCKVKFDDEKTYWYRTNDYGFMAGMKVIVPVTGNGLWKIGTIVEAAVYKTEDVPYPLIRTKGIVGKAGFFAESKVRSHNALINKSKYPPIDISLADVQTKNGKVVYCTCARERELIRQGETMLQNPRLLIENYPVSKESAIPKEALKRMRDFIQKRNKLLWQKYELARKTEQLRQRLQFERDIEFEEEMEDLDQYN